MTTWTEERGKAEVSARANRQCEICGQSAALEWSHRIPRSRGGTWSPANGVGACHRCHMSLHARPSLAYAGGWHLQTGHDPAASPVWLVLPWPTWWLIDDAPADGGPHLLVAAGLDLDAPALPFSPVSRAL